MDTGTIGVFKLVSSEEIIAEFEDKGEIIILTSPRAIRSMPINTPHGVQFVPGVGPWNMAIPDDDFNLRKELIMVWSTDVEPKILEAYLKNTTGLEISTNAAKIIT